MKLCSDCANVEMNDSLVCINCGGINLADLKQETTKADKQLVQLRANVEALRTWFKEYGRDGLIVHGYNVSQEAEAA